MAAIRYSMEIDYKIQKKIHYKIQTQFQEPKHYNSLHLIDEMYAWQQS